VESCSSSAKILYSLLSRCTPEWGAWGWYGVFTVTFGEACRTRHACSHASCCGHAGSCSHMLKRDSPIGDNLRTRINSQYAPIYQNIIGLHHDVTNCRGSSKGPRVQIWSNLVFYTSGIGFDRTRLLLDFFMHFLSGWSWRVQWFWRHVEHTRTLGAHCSCSDQNWHSERGLTPFEPDFHLFKDKDIWELFTLSTSRDLTCALIDGFDGSYLKYGQSFMQSNSGKQKAFPKLIKQKMGSSSNISSTRLDTDQETSEKDNPAAPSAPSPVGLATAPIQPPNGGKEAWLFVLAGFFIFINSW